MSGPEQGVFPRVLYSFPHPLGRPGIGTTALWQVRSLVALGVPVTVWTTSLAVAGDELGPVHETLRVMGRRIPHRAMGVDRTLHLHDRMVAHHVARNTERYDVVHCWPSATLHTAGAARRAGVAVVREVPNTHTAHAYEVAGRVHRVLGVQFAPNASHRSNGSRLRHELAEYDAVDLLLVPSDHVRDTFMTRGCDPAKLARHRYGFDPSRFRPATGAARAVPSFTALYLGSCEPRKGLHLALQAWIASGAADIGRLLVCGRFVPGYREHLAPLLAHPSVEVLPARSDVETLLQQSDVLLLPSLEEGSALVTYEAQGAGCALLVSDAAGAVVTHGVNGLVHPAGDVALLTEQLRMVATEPALTTRLRAGAREAAPALSWAEAGRRLLDIYLTVAPAARTHQPAGASGAGG
jgi:glycosyltransferase involved in cell wall biosynthesis